MKTIKESHKRSILKAISWRAFGMAATTLIVFVFTRKIILSLSIGLAEAFAKMLLYYLHERIWGKISWGCVKHPLSQIPVKGELKPEDTAIIHGKLKELGYVD